MWVVHVVPLGLLRGVLTVEDRLVLAGLIVNIAAFAVAALALHRYAGNRLCYCMLTWRSMQLLTLMLRE